MSKQVAKHHRKAARHEGAARHVKRARAGRPARAKKAVTREEQAVGLAAEPPAEDQFDKALEYIEPSTDTVEVLEIEVVSSPENSLEFEAETLIGG